MLSDILPTGFEIGVQYGDVGEGDVVAVIGAGPVGLAAIMTAASAGASKVIFNVRSSTAVSLASVPFPERASSGAVTAIFCSSTKLSNVP